MRARSSAPTRRYHMVYHSWRHSLQSIPRFLKKRPSRKSSWALPMAPSRLKLFTSTRSGLSYQGSILCGKSVSIMSELHAQMRLEKYKELVQVSPSLLQFYKQDLVDSRRYTDVHCIYRLNPCSSCLDGNHVSLHHDGWSDAC